VFGRGTIVNEASEQIKIEWDSEQSNDDSKTLPPMYIGLTDHE
jgi:hypothetical protein